MKKVSLADYDIFVQVAKRYAQTTTTNTLTVNPQEVQVGQSVFDENDQEFIVLESEDANTSKVLMPAGQVNTGGLPENVQTVEDVELESDYTLQPSGAQKTVSAFRSVLPEFREFKDAKRATIRKLKERALEQDQVVQVSKTGKVLSGFRNDG